jgi:adenylate cyclase class 2
MIEVELKAHLRDRSATLAAVASFAAPDGRVDKRDAYWHGPGWRLDRGERGFRVRREGEASVVTFKSKRTEGGIEVNREREFAVSDEAAFVEFALRLGCEAFYGKRKTGAAFKAARATIEIVDVEGLGDFIEVEILLDDEDPEKIAQAKAGLLALLARAGVGEADIEPRFYSELLMESGIVARP